SLHDALTISDGTYSATGTAMPGAAATHSDNAKYPRDGSDTLSGPITANYNTLKHDVTLTALTTAVKWSLTHALTGKLTDNDAGSSPVSGAAILPAGDDTFGAGPFTTAADGTYSATGTAPPGPAAPHSDTARYPDHASYNLSRA